MRVLFVLNDPAYGSERSFNGLRLASALVKREHDVRLFLMGDAVTCAMGGQQVPAGYYHLDRMIDAVARDGGEIGCCSSCLDARGMTDELLTKGARRSSLDELALWTEWADKALVF
jgi:uncharacterized protein involved in oxidation of intracellular sulfur